MKENITFIEKLALRLCEAIGIIVLAAAALYAFDQIDNPLIAALCSLVLVFFAYLGIAAMADSKLVRKQNKKKGAE